MVGSGGDIDHGVVDHVAADVDESSRPYHIHARVVRVASTIRDLRRTREAPRNQASPGKKRQIKIPFL